MLWRANMDLQYISETSLALTEYVSGYVTKAEKSNVQDIWNDITVYTNVSFKVLSVKLYFHKNHHYLTTAIHFLHISHFFTFFRSIWVQRNLKKVKAKISLTKFPRLTVYQISLLI